MKSLTNMVKEFNQKFNIPIGGPGFLLSEKRALLRVRLNQGENAELTEAVQLGDYPAIAKEAADLLYVVIGMCVETGIEIEEVFEEVHRSNMTKSLDKDAGGKVVKGEGYVAPNVALVLAERQLATNLQVSWVKRWNGR